MLYRYLKKHGRNVTGSIPQSSGRMASSEPRLLMQMPEVRTFSILLLTMRIILSLFPNSTCFVKESIHFGGLASSPMAVTLRLANISMKWLLFISCRQLADFVPEQDAVGVTASFWYTRSIRQLGSLDHPNIRGTC